MRIVFVFALAAGLMLAPQQPSGDRASLDAEFKRAVETQDWPAAISAGRRLADLLPNDPVIAYNLACAYSQSGDKERAVAWLATAAERGFYYTSTLLRDEHLDLIRAQSGYAEALAAVRQNSAAELDKFKLKHGDAKVITSLPPGLDKSRPAPLIVALHGRGGSAADISRVWQNASDEAGAILIAPQAVTPHGNGFHWGVVEQAEWLVLNAIERAKAANKIDERRIVLTGFSQGGAMTYVIGLKHPEMFAGLIPVGGYYEHRLAPVPETPKPLPRVWIMYGELDGDVENNREAARRFEAIGSPCKLKVYPGLGHAFPANRDAELREALRFVL